ncbi:uncharacterized protein EDB93DRAFT_1253173 [Suillus bovinus]|uniref:uncharacterized protein n=1 Tax=Suillus bovinus TaxID=48563 RepID=UPI001B86A553|nr:uncharacterized protein EDB93DRAFT_1253173 [Suillus bovinus]KAG2139105.1 hypothetical protein EDB93DRAFT_1253173 [Suillus bovinus]
MHLIRLLYALPMGSQLVATLDERFCQVPTFNFEDILQCAIPVFEGLFPTNHDKLVQFLLYRFAQWHTLAKLRIHSESTVNLLEETFKALSLKLQKFQRDTCSAFTTTELPKERTARQKRFVQCSETNTTPPEPSGVKVKKFNLNTYKFHKMGDYVRTIKLFGSTGSFTTQMGELAHRALKDFMPKLKDHVLYRLQQLDIGYCDHTFTDKECNSVIIPNNTIYSVQTMQIYYTMYDLRCKYDTINPRTYGDVMVVSEETAPSHPYWYAHILGIYHMEMWINVDGEQPIKQHLEVLWVQWLAPLRNHQSGMKHTRLPKVAFVDESDLDAFGFLDPGQVVRGAHLIPAFASGRGSSSLRYGQSLGHPGGEPDDWEVYYVGICTYIHVSQENGIFDAIDKQYLQKVIFGIYLDSKDPTNIVEAYTFNFHKKDALERNIVWSADEDEDTEGEMVIDEGIVLARFGGDVVITPIGICSEDGEVRPLPQVNVTSSPAHVQTSTSAISTQEVDTQYLQDLLRMKNDVSTVPDSEMLDMEMQVLEASGPSCNPGTTGPQIPHHSNHSKRIDEGQLDCDCGISKINDASLLCEGGCNCWFHVWYGIFISHTKQAF